MTADNVGRSFGYSLLNRLTSSSYPGLGTVTLGYDALGRLSHYNGGIDTRIAHDGDDRIVEQDAAGAVLRTHVHGPGVDEPLVSYEGGQRKWLHADERGSIFAHSDNAGNVVTINRYDEYGLPAAGNVGTFQYTGQVWMPEIGVYHYKARAYHPGLPRFLQADPIGYGSGMNMYAYVKGDPVNFTDPSGLSPQCDEPIRTYHYYGQTDPVTGKHVPGTPAVYLGFSEYARCESNGPGSDVGPAGGGPRLATGGKPNAKNATPTPRKLQDPVPIRCAGPVRAEGVNFTGILGLGVTISFGKVTVNGSGASSWFLSLGVGAGVDAGISGFVSTYRDIGSFSGYGESYNGSVAIGSRTFGGSASYNVQGERVGLIGSGSGVPAGYGGRVGVSGTVTDTALLNGPCK